MRSSARLALNLRGLARSTEDLDLFVAPDAENIERLKLALTDALADILTRLGEAFHYADLETERVPFEDITVTAVTPRMLYRMKRDTVRLKDQADAAAIRQRFGIED